MSYTNQFILSLFLLVGGVQFGAAQCPTSGNLTVTITANAGTNSLRWAIDCVNTTPALTTIVFDIPAIGVNTINLSSALPAITKSGAIVDGTAVESVIINGSLITPLSNGIVISAPNVTVRGVRITGFNSGAPAGAGILVSGNDANVANNYLYNNRAGIIVRDPAGAGPPIPVLRPSLTGNTIGLNFAGAASGNSSNGILFENTANDAVVNNNTIAHNGGNGVRLNVAGGQALISQNGMYCNASDGIFRMSSPALPTVSTANTQRITGTAGAFNLVEVFEYHDTGCPTFAPCQGRILVGTATANILGNWTLNLAPGAVTAGNRATATRTVGGNNTYGFAGCIPIADCSNFSVSITPTPINCFGNNNGQLTAAATGTTAPPAFLWSNGATTATITGLSPGTYTVTATDPATACTAVASHTLVEPPELTLTVSGTNVQCLGNANGSATANPGGGTPNYQYLWSTGATTQTINNLGPGTYFITVTDANLCRIFGNVTISQPAALSVNMSSTGETAFNANNGTATAAPFGGTPIYNYLWSNGGTTATISNLAPGTYSVTVTDMNGCTTTGSATVTAFDCSGFSATVSGNNISCNGGSNGSATATPSGGMPVYTYQWSNGGTTQTISNLTQGTYSVTVTDGSNCPVVRSITLTQPAALSVNMSSTGETAFNANNGTATAAPSGGTPTYNYLWSNGATTATITNLAPGTYSVTVTDINGCTVTGSVTVSAFDCSGFSTSISSSNISCNGGSNGSATATPSGGMPVYTYLWSNGGTTQTISNLTQGTYSVTVTDGSNCSVVQNITLTQPPALGVNMSSTGETALNANNGTATAAPFGGTPIYTYLWSNGGTTAVITNLAPGAYSVTVTDVSGCIAIGSTTVNAFNCGSFSATVSGSNVSCNGGNNGSATATPAGGMPVYTYLWSNGGTTQTISNLTQGTYSVTVTDMNNCAAVQSITLTQPAALNVNMSSTGETALNANNGTATAAPAGGTPPYTYLWSNGGTTAVITNLAPGTYSVTVTDMNGCTVNGSTTVDAFNCAGFSATVSGNNISCNGGSNGSATATPSGGMPGYTYQWSNGGTTQTISNLTQGTYSVTVTDGSNCPVVQSITLTQPAALSVNMSSTDETALNANNGTATATPAGGTPVYTYEWNNGDTTQVSTGLAPGTYSATVTDMNGCTVTGTVSVNSFSCAGFSATVSGSNISCNGGNNGSATAAPVGGMPSYTYLWSNGATTPTISNLAPGTYSVTVTDMNNCMAVQNITLTQPPALSVSVTSNPETVLNAGDGMATATPSGGTPGYTYQWSNGGATQTITGLTPGTYSVTVTDLNGCAIFGAATVIPGQPGPNCTAQPVYAVSIPGTVCQNAPLGLEADDLYPSSNVRYIWFIPNGDSVTTTAPRVDIIAASAAFAGEYFVLRDSLGCRSTRVGGAPVAVLSLPDDAAAIAVMDTVLCAPATIELRALPAMGGPGVWQSLGAAVVDAPTQTMTLARNLQRGANRFVWKVTLEACNLTAADTLTAFVEGPPVVRNDHYTLQRAQDILVMEVLLNDDLSGLPDTVMLQVGGPDVGELEFLENTRRFRYTVTEDFRGQVSFQYMICNPSARCGFGCDTATVTIDVLNLPTVPEGLVLNDPGLNGELFIKGLRGFTRVEIQIFNRWGDLVFQERSYDNDNPWRGHIQRSGKALPQAAYYYSLRAFEGETLIGGAQKGIIHLFEQKK